MAISLGTPTSSGNKTNSSGFSFAHTLNSNAKCLVVVITGYDSSATDSVVSSVTWNTANSLSASCARYRVGSDFQHIWHLTNPPTGGPYNIAVTMAKTCTDVQATAIGLIDATAVSIDYDSFDTGTGTGSASAVVSPAATGSVAVGGGVAIGGTTGSLSVSTGTEISGSEVDMGSQTASCGTASESGGSATITWSYSAVVCTALAATFKPNYTHSKSIYDATTIQASTPPHILANFNGSDGATSYTSDDGFGRSATFYAGAQLSTSEKKFGTASLKVTASGDYISFPSFDAETNPNEPVTMECWVRFTTLPGTDGYAVFCSQYRNASEKWGWGIRDSTGTTYCYHYISGSDTSLAITPSTGVWYHTFIAFIPETSTTWKRVFGFNGNTSVGTAQTTRFPAYGAIDLVLGYGSSVPAYTLGHIDGFRFTRQNVYGTGATYTVPTGEYSAETIWNEATTEIVTASSDKSKSVYDTISVSESLSKTDLLSISVFDTINVSENVTPLIANFAQSLTETWYERENTTTLHTNNVSLNEVWYEREATSTAFLTYLSIFDTLTAADNVDKLLNLSASLADVMTAAETVTPLIANYTQSLIDTVYEREQVDKLLSISASVFDTITEAENTTLQGLITLSIFDTIYERENLSPDLKLALSIFDLTKMSENVTPLITNFSQSVFDVMYVRDSATPLTILNQTLFDQINVSENVTPFLITNLTLTETWYERESVTPLIANFAQSVFDTIRESEQVDKLLSIQQSLFDQINVSESVTPEVSSGELTKSLSDQINVSENLAPLIPVLVKSVYDLVQVSENVSPLIKNYVQSLADSVTIQDFTDRALLLVQALTDNIRISENVSRDLSIGRSLLDAISVLENVNPLIPILLQQIADDLTVSDYTGSLVPFLAQAIQDDITVQDGFDYAFSELGTAIWDTITVEDYASNASAIGVSLNDILSVSDATQQDRALDTYWIVSSTNPDVLDLYVGGILMERTTAT